MAFNNVHAHFSSRAYVPVAYYNEQFLFDMHRTFHAMGLPLTVPGPGPDFRPLPRVYYQGFHGAESVPGAKF